MSAVLEENSCHDDAQMTAPVVVIGTGPVGIRFVEELPLRNHQTPLVIYGNELSFNCRREPTRSVDLTAHRVAAPFLCESRPAARQARDLYLRYSLIF